MFDARQIRRAMVLAGVFDGNRIRYGHTRSEVARADLGT
jgi:hypothetical protein